MNEPNYFVIIFKNNKKRKILKTFITEKKAYEFFEKKIKESDDIIFNVQYENGKSVNYKIAVVSKKYNDDQIYYIDELGRNKIINQKLSDDLYINKISKLNKEEKIFDLNKNKRINLNDLIKKYLDKSKIYMISQINNKFVIQDDDNYHLFSLKNESDCDRLLDILMDKNEKKNLIIVKDFSTPQRKYLYEQLENKGFNKDFLYRKSTTHPKEK